MSDAEKNPLEGISRHNCPTACRIDHCVLGAGRPHCCDPCGAGVPFSFKDDPAVQKIYSAACATLGVRNRNERHDRCSRTANRTPTRTNDR
jgi:hypothetical protein